MQKYVEEFSKIYFEYYAQNISLETKPYPYTKEMLQKYTKEK